jgi:hypothetical protein
MMYPNEFILICRTQDESDVASKIVGNYRCPPHDPICHKITNGKWDREENSYRYLSDIDDWENFQSSKHPITLT